MNYKSIIKKVQAQLPEHIAVEYSDTQSNAQNDILCLQLTWTVPGKKTIMFPKYQQREGQPDDEFISNIISDLISRAK